jgi:hypothetical protein
LVAYSAIQEFEWVRAGEMRDGVLCAAAADVYTIFDLRTMGNIEQAPVFMALAKVGVEGKLSALGRCQSSVEGLAGLRWLERHDGSGQGLECWSHY